MRNYTKVSLTWNEQLGRYVIDYDDSEWTIYNGPIDLLCGATSQQKQLESEQANYYSVMTKQAQEVFDIASSITKQLQSIFGPIEQAGPNQEGFSVLEKDTLNREITDSTGQAFKKAADATNQSIAAEGGGDVPIVSSANDLMREDLATSAATMEAGERNQVQEESFAVGRQNFYQAASILAGATNVFNPAAGFGNAATNAGTAAANTADQIAQENNSWVNAAIGAIGGVAAGFAGNPAILGSKPKSG